jgi:hypothetical protein
MFGPLIDILMSVVTGVLGNLAYDLLKTMLLKRRFSKPLPLVIRLLKLTLPSDEIQENIIGDLLEEFEQFGSKALAYLWLSKQVIKSLLPLAYKTIKARLAARFEERIR